MEPTREQHGNDRQGRRQYSRIVARGGRVHDRSSEFNQYEIDDQPDDQNDGGRPVRASASDQGGDGRHEGDAENQTGDPLS